MTRWILALVGALMTMACTTPLAQAVIGHPAADCDRTALIREAASDLGEHRAFLRLVGPAEMAELTGDPTSYGAAEPETVAFLTTIECRYVKSTVAHELTHVWQFRAIGDRDDLYGEFGHDRAEVLADCGSVLTGWHDYYPYLAARGYGCTGAELEQARQLRGWAK